MALSSLFKFTFALPTRQLAIISSIRSLIFPDSSRPRAMIIVIPLWQQLLESALSFAVPKKKVSHGRKRRRYATKYLRPLENITICKTCQQPKLLHHICDTCLARYRIHIKKQSIISA